MSYNIIFKTKIINLSDGRILHLDLSGCNNDTEGRDNDNWKGKIYTKEDFVKYAEEFTINSKPSKESGGFDLKIGSRYCTYYDYGTHLLRMMKRAVSFDELKRSEDYVSFNKIDGATVFEDEKEIKMSVEEFESYYYSRIYNGGIRYKIDTTLLETEKDIISAFDNGDSIRIYIG